jgi:hypothetical protein
MNRLAPTSSCFLSEEAYKKNKDRQLQLPRMAVVVACGALSSVEDGLENLRRTLLTLMGFPHNFI